jgi:hypothetical protein
MAEQNRHINEAVQHSRRAHPNWQQEARASLNEAIQGEWGRLFLRETPAFQQVYDQLNSESFGDSERIQITRAIEELYTFSPLINRTRRRDIGEFTTRKPETLMIDFTPEQRTLHDGLLDVIARILTHCHGQQNVKFMMTTIRRQAASCLYGLAPLLSDMLGGKLDQLEIMEAVDSDEDVDNGFVEQIKSDIEGLLQQASSLNPSDPKIKAFVRVLLDKNARTNNKAMVFSTFRHTLAYLYEHALDAGLRVGLIHGGVADDDRADLRHRFALPKEDPEAIDVLLSSEVGCEGLDFQFCDFLINYDLPWNPMRVEQRIGRIDRYGQQSETVGIINFVTPGTVDADIYERCLWRIGVFQHAVGGSEEILGTITQQIHDIAESFTLTPEERASRLQQLADNGIRQLREEEELESKQSELFGLNVPNPSWREDIEAAESVWLSATSIQNAVTAYLACRLGNEREVLLGDKPVKTLRLSQEGRAQLLDDYRKLRRSVEPVAREWEKWLKGDQPILSVTFEQDSATENPKTIHLSVVHPLIRQAAQYWEITEPKYFCTSIRSSTLAAGHHLFAIYRWMKHGVKNDELMVPVANDPLLEDQLLSLLQSSTGHDLVQSPDDAAYDALDARHHHKWADAQADHIAENRQIVENRLNSLTVSHRTRIKAIEDQIARATNDKIRLMKQSELVRATADFDQRITELQRAASTGDIRTNPVVFGTIIVTVEAI